MPVVVHDMKVNCKCAFNAPIEVNKRSSNDAHVNIMALRELDITKHTFLLVCFASAAAAWQAIAVDYAYVRIHD